MYSETLWPESYDCNALYTLIEGPWKYIQSRRPELYDLDRDPGERDNRIDKEPAVARGLRADLEDLRKRMPAAAGSPGGASALVDQETLRRLESLGYIGGGVDRERLGPDAGQEDPKDFVALFERLKTASQLVREQRDQKAEQILLELVAQRPRLILARNALAEIALGHSRPTDAIKHLSAALSALAEAKETAAPVSRKNTALLRHHLHELLARALVMAQKPDPAIAELQIAVSCVPDVNDEFELIELLDFRRRYQEAVAACGRALETAPRNAPLRNKLAWMLATCPEASVRDGAKALEIARLLVEGPGRREPRYLDTLAAAYAEAGQFGKAVATAEEALALARSARQARLVLSVQSHLDAYRAGHAYRQM
jgi:tetratricopeptide (TPR) repeat protein